MVVKIVIGANFGDEGKGLMTDYFCNQAISENQKCIVVLHNGGAQRGHTVLTTDARRHVFHHFGSGTFAGADTYFAKDFILNPVIFHLEYEELSKKLDCEFPKVYVDPACRVTTPFDMIANQIIEEHRGDNKHGSCGYGIWETIRRCEYVRDINTLSDISYYANTPHYNANIYGSRIWDDYYARRFYDKKIKLSDEWKKIITDDNLMIRYLKDVQFMNDHIDVKPIDHQVLSDYDCIVFEGGQGLLLDQNNKEYIPNITPSNTGIDNPLNILDSFSDDIEIDGEVCYVTRSYLTRHGAGKFFTECSKDEINSDMMDFTNVHNPHQGSLRYGKLSFPDLWIRTDRDFNKLREKEKYDFEKSLVITHINEYFNENQVIRVAEELDFDKIYLSPDEDWRNIYEAVY